MKLLNNDDDLYTELVMRGMEPANAAHLEGVLRDVQKLYELASVARAEAARHHMYAEAVYRVCYVLAGFTVLFGSFSMWWSA